MKTSIRSRQAGTARCAVRAAYQRRNEEVSNARAVAITPPALRGRGRRSAPSLPLVTAFLLLFIAAACVTTRAAAPKLPETFDVSAVDAFLGGQVQQSNNAGLTVAIVKDGQ